MNTVFRTHIKNQQRLETFERTLKSWYQKKLDQLGNLYVIDDQSPMEEEVINLANKYDALYTRTLGDADTKNGLYWSLKVQDKFPVLCCVDDMVFGQDTLARIKQIEEVDIPTIGRYSTIGLFACYQEATRTKFKIEGLELWQIPHSLLYALVAHVFSGEMARIYTECWEGVLAGTLPYPNMCDDILVKILSINSDLLCYNTTKDYAQHTGMNNRTFGTVDENAANGIGSSDYISSDFVGEW
jgi:hypothetical protein